MNDYVKMIVGIIVVIAALMGLFYVEGSKKSSRVADITVSIEVRNESVRVINIEGVLEPITKISLPQGNLAITPGISVALNQEKIPISDWYSVSLNGSGTYKFRMGLYDTFSEDKPVSVYVQAINEFSQEVAAVQKELSLK